MDMFARSTDGKLGMMEGKPGRFGGCVIPICLLKRVR